MLLLRRSLTNIRKIPQMYYVQENAQRHISRWVAPTMKELKRRRDKLGPEKPSPRSSYLEWNYEAEIYAFGKRLGENFDREILKRALVDRSYAYQKNEGGESEILLDNKELIEEGSDIINKYLSDVFSKIYISEIANSFVEYLTTEEMLAHVAKHLGLTDLVLSNEFPVETYTLSNSFKAIVAALKHSENIEKCHKFIADFLIVQLNGKTVYDVWEPKDPIEYLNNLLNERGIEQFESRLCNESASNTILANYQVGLYSNKKLLGIGWGESIEIAQNTAALDAIKRIHNFY